MDWQIRIAIILAGIVLIGYVVYDFSKKKKRRDENDKLKRKFELQVDQLDNSGFDLTGVGHARPASSEDTQNSEVDILVTEPIIQIDINNNNPIEAANDNNKSTDDTLADVSQQLNEEQHPPIVEQPKLVLSFILQAKQGHQFVGKDFLPIFLSQGLRHGEMGIFHRFTKAGPKTGPVLFSLANGIAPGTFEINNIDKFSTPALALFMTLPGPEDAQIAYNAMFNTIKLLKKELGGEILDESKQLYSEKTHNERLDQIQQYLGQFTIN